MDGGRDERGMEAGEGRENSRDKEGEKKKRTCGACATSVHPDPSTGRSK